MARPPPWPHPPLSSNLFLLEQLAGPEDVVREGGNRRLNGSPTRPHGPTEVLLWDSSRTKHIPGLGSRGGGGGGGGSRGGGRKGS